MKQLHYAGLRIAVMAGDDEGRLVAIRMGTGRGLFLPYIQHVKHMTWEYNVAVVFAKHLGLHLDEAGLKFRDIKYLPEMAGNQMSMEYRLPVTKCGEPNKAFQVVYLEALPDPHEAGDRHSWELMAQWFDTDPEITPFVHNQIARACRKSLS